MLKKHKSAHSPTFPCTMMQKLPQKPCCNYNYMERSIGYRPRKIRKPPPPLNLTQVCVASHQVSQALPRGRLAHFNNRYVQHANLRTRFSVDLEEMTVDCQSLTYHDPLHTLYNRWRFQWLFYGIARRSPTLIAIGLMPAKGISHDVLRGALLSFKRCSQPICRLVEMWVVISGFYRSRMTGNSPISPKPARRRLCASIG